MAAEAPAAVPDFGALRACWHPVGYASSFAAEPRRVRLLGNDLVVWRDSAGTPRVLRDLCIHRGTALSLGRVVGDELMCPYHGWRYGAGGRCTAIPQLADPTRVPGKAARERYGLMWVAMDDARWELPEIPELESPDWLVVECGPYA